MNSTRPTAGPPTQAEIDSDLQAGIELIEQLGFEFGHRVSRSAIRDTLEQAVEGSTNSDGLVWHAWLLNSCRSFGLRGRAIDCMIGQAVEMATNGARIITRCDDNSWLAFAGAGRGRLRLLCAALAADPSL